MLVSLFANTQVKPVDGNYQINSKGEFQMLGSRSPVVQSDIESIVALSHNHTVFLLNGFQDDCVVVKKEWRGSATNMQNVNRVMMAIDPASRVSAMGPSEVTAIQNFAQSIGAANPTDAHLVQLLNHAFNHSNSGFWCRMDLQQLTDADSALKAAAFNKDKSGVRQIAAILNRPGGLERLGEIIAADAFAGNGDRFAFQIPIKDQRIGVSWAHKATMGFKKVTNFWYLLNEGNVIFSLGNDPKPAGLDAFDGNSEFTKWSGPLQKNMSQEHWPGHLLRPDGVNARRTYTERIAEDLNVVLGQRNRRLPVFSKLRLQKDAGQRLLNGMNQGAEKIRVHLTSKYESRLMPQGLSERFAALTWPLPRQGRVQWTAIRTRTAQVSI
jgi:hypothetical protein